jgi:hypothetical protein
MSFISEGQGLSGLFKSIKIIMFKFEDNQFKNNKVIANNSKNKQNLDIWPWRSRSFTDEGVG